MTKKTITGEESTNDPLGMLELKRVVSLLILSRDEAGNEDRWSSLVDQLDTAFCNTIELYEMLKDRYLLLKRHTAQLEDELGWLRDQVDDLASMRDDKPQPPTGPGRPRRRYEDRGQR